MDRLRDYPGQSFEHLVRRLRTTEDVRPSRFEGSPSAGSAHLPPHSSEALLQSLQAPGREGDESYDEAYLEDGPERLNGDTRFTYFVVQTFVLDADGFLIGEEAQEAKDRPTAVASAIAYSADKAGVLAFSKTGSMDTGEYEDAVILFQAGQLPEDLKAWMGPEWV